MTLNEAAFKRALPLREDPAAFGATCVQRGGVWVVDCGVDSAGGTAAGLAMAESSMGGLGHVTLSAGGVPGAGFPWPMVGAASDSPVAACLAAQYAGWKVSTKGYFAMASGPMRAAIGREELFDEIGLRERPPVAVGLLETASLPPDDVCGSLAEAAGVAPDHLLLLAARTASVAGTLQVVARSLETALHKLHDLRFDLTRVVRGSGTAPLPPIPADDLAAIGRTNDAILYGGAVTIDVTGDDASLAAIGPRAVSRSSASYGEPFAVLFDRAGRDFYALDPALFAPAMLTLVNIDTGHRHVFGACAPDILARSFTTD